MNPRFDDLYMHFRGLGVTVRRDELLSSHTSFGLGGTADLWVEPESVEMLSLVLKEARAHNVPITLLGGGTNILFPDDGYRGIILSTLGLIRFSAEEEVVTALAGVPLSRIISLSLRIGLAGLAELTGIPGSVGGAVRGNAGAYGSSIGTVLDEINVCDSAGISRWIKRSECGFDYRYCDIPHDHVITGIRCVLKYGDPVKIQKIAREILHDRLKKQPLGERSAGSIFKNPPGESAGRILDDEGLKGFRVGGARISERHANWIIVDETATARDVVELIDTARRKVYEDRRILLETELVIVEPKP